MAWTTPKTDFASGNILTAAQMNAIGENLVVLRNNSNNYASYRYTSGFVTLTGTTTWSTLTTIGTAADLTVDAAAGDVIEAGVFALIGNAAVVMGFDPVTVVGSTVTNSFGANGAAPAAWSNFSGSGFYMAGGVEYNVSGSIPYTVVAGDVSGGNVKVRLRYAMASATNRILQGSAENPFMWWIRNHGPVT